MKPSSFHNDYYSIGCPVWNCESWRGTVYRAAAKREQWLSQYSQVFNSVEGNSTFYGLPAIETVRKWSERATAGFQFCLKFPRVITHDLQLRNCEFEKSAFFDRLSVLKEAEVLGPSLLQLSPAFSPRQFSELKNFLEQLPETFDYAVEVRHLDWFQDDVANQLNDFLNGQNVDRVVFDARPLFSRPATDEMEQQSQQRKPNLPVSFPVTGRRPMLRLIGRNTLADIEPWFEEWTALIADWIQSGLRPIVFTHTPDDSLAPEFAMKLHNALATKYDRLESMEQWPHVQQVQRELF